ncbi:class F sortase [Streptomyces sp. NPDC005925]|uniref:class F sortase n=1 Tax=Streptomyces sp. NPDC005925 TaxID=3157172 RepID=UPI0034110F50
MTYRAQHQGRPRGHTVAAVLCALGTLAMAFGAAVLVGPRYTGGAGPVRPAAASAGTPADGQGPTVPEEVRGPGFRARLVPVAARGDGALDLPDDARSGAWWALGAPAGAERGTVLVAGHVDTRRAGLGVFAALHGLRVGAKIDLIGANGRAYRYVITARRTYPRQSLPPGLFSRAGPHRLALVTCTGVYDGTTGGYDRNLVLYAAPARRHGAMA